MAEIKITNIQVKRANASTWSTQNPILLDGEIGFERDTNQIKIGNGTDNYNTLQYLTGSGGGGGGFSQEQIEDIIDALIAGGTGITKVYDDVNGTLTLSISDEVYTTSEKTKLSNIEAGAQVNPTDADIVASVDAELGQTDWKVKLTTEEVQDIMATALTGGTQTNITVTYDDVNNTFDFFVSGGGGGGGLTQEEVEDIVDGLVTAGAGVNKVYNDAGGTLTISLSDEVFTLSEKNKLAGIQAGATDDQSPAEIKAAYESNPDTNEFTDAEKAKLAALDENSTDDQTAAEVPFTPTGNTTSNNVQDAIVEIQSDVDGLSSGAGNPNITVANNLADITGASTDIVEVRGDITLTSNYTVPADKELMFTTGSITTDRFNIIGDNTTLSFPDTKTYIQLDETSQLTGTWNPPKHFYTTNLGVRAEGSLEIGTGSITSGSTTFTTTGGAFTANDVGKTIAIVDAGQNADAGQPDNYVHTAVISSFTNSTTVEISVAAVNSTSGANYMYGWDDANIVDQALRLRNQSGGTLEFTAGTEVFTSTYDRNPNLTVRPVGWTVGDGTSGIEIIISGDIQIFPHDTPDSQLLTLWRTRGSSIVGKGGIIKGDYKTPDGIEIYTSENGKGEHNHGVCWFSLTVDSIFENLKVYGFYGDAFYGQGDTQFMNQIDGTNNIDGATDSTISVGYIDETGAIQSGETDFVYTTSLLPLTGFQFDNITSLGLQRWTMLTGGSFGNWSGLSNPYYYIAYYDAGGTFQYRSDKLTWFQRVYIPEDTYTQARIVFFNPDQYGGSTADIEATLRPDLHAFGGYMKNCTGAHCGRQGISNGPSNYTIEENTFHDIGGLDAGPGFGIDYEDGGRTKQNIRIINNVFYNNWGGITTKNPENVVISGNRVGPNTKDLTEAPTNTFEVGISTVEGRNVVVSDNMIYNAQSGVDRQAHWYGNKLYGGRFSYSSNGSKVNDNQFWDMSFIHNVGSSDRVDHPTIFENNEIRITQKYQDYLFDEDGNAASFYGNRFLFNDVGNWETNKERSDNNIELGATFLGEQVNRLFLRQSMTTDFGGEWKDNIFEGLFVKSDTSSGNGAFPLLNYEGDRIGTSMEFGNGLQKDFYLKNVKVEGWLEFDLPQWNNSLTASPGTVSILDSEIVIDNTFAWTNNGANILTTAEKDMNLYVENTVFRIEPTYTLVNRQKFFDLNHFGTTVFKNVTFDTSLANFNMDMTDTTAFGTTLGAVTFINCKFLNGMTVTLRAQDDIQGGDFGEPDNILALYTKGTPTSSDWVIISDTADGNKTKKAAFPTGGGGGGAGSLNDLSDVDTGTAPVANTSGTLRILADPNTDGTYNVIDWSPPGGSSVTVTSDLINDGEDGTSSFAELDEVILLDGGGTVTNGPVTFQDDVNFGNSTNALSNLITQETTFSANDYRYTQQISNGVLRLGFQSTGLGFDNRIAFKTDGIEPIADNTLDLGDPLFRWQQMYSYTFDTPNGDSNDWNITASIWGQPLGTTAALIAISEATLTDKEIRYVEDGNQLYAYDAEAVSGDLAPSDQAGGTGFWILLNGSGTAQNLSLSGTGNADLNISGGNSIDLSTVDGISPLNIVSDITGVTGADPITNIISLTQSEYDAIGSPDASTYYVITDASLDGTDVSLDTTNFNNNLSGTDTTVQAAMETIDDLVLSGGGASALDDLSDVDTTTSPTADSSATLRVLADTNSNGTYNVIDWTPPSSGVAGLQTSTITITDPVISGGRYEQQLVAAQGPNTVIHLVSVMAYANGVSAINNTTIDLNFEGSDTDFGGGLLFTASGTGFRVVRPDQRLSSDAANLGWDVALINGTDQTMTGDITVHAEYYVVNV